ncbi:chondroitin sulfate proteoglycan 5 isoform X2 [Nematolebias whitei]|uniref:chondroitin sulfate proteoglycan 5 isoform X2 n=1 Tax=Nematolebias whitei TaxID=451745 RepID=UPI0018990E27|nr:chondroitin sulfate proteoglycan 5 isoform X2 [Nematolebias whitei]
MARAHSRMRSWQVLLTISAVFIPLCVHGRHSLVRRHHHHNHSTVNKEALDTRMVLSDDSAEREHLIGAGVGAKHPHTRHHHSHKSHYLDLVEQPAAEELTAGGAGPDQPGNPLSDDIIKVEFHSPAPDVVPADDALDWAKVPKPQKQKGGDPTATWTMAEIYDYLSPDNEFSAVDTTPEPEPTPSPPADMEDENPLLAGSPSKPENEKPNMDSGSSLPAPPMLGAEREEEFGLGGAVGADGCRLGFVLSGPGVCVSECDNEPNFCLNGGMCTVVAGVGAFCRCNVQDYIWNKGLRCEWAVTEFQVLCVVVAVASFVFLLLFMIVVFFAKSLYRLKSENIRLRKRSKYRPQSTEPQTDGLSVSTTADGSQPNNDPQKKDNQDKSPQPNEEGSMNILNSHSPKQENNRPASAVLGHTPNNTGENAEDGVTIGLEVLLPKEAKLHLDTSSPLQYDVFLYKIANNGDSASHSQAPPPHSSTSHVISKSPKSPKQTKAQPCINCEPESGRHSSPSRHPHLVHGGYPPTSSSQHKCMSTSASPLLHRGQAPGTEHSGGRRDNQSGRIRPSPSSPHLTQPPPSPSGMKNYAVSTHSLPP